VEKKNGPEEEWVLTKRRKARIQVLILWSMLLRPLLPRTGLQTNAMGKVVDRLSHIRLGEY
jgi:hypothetical protein